MDRGELSELHYITPIANLGSIMTNGIVSNRRAKALGGISIAMPEVQARRSVKRVPRGLPLHDYVNLYINCRNPMLSSRRHEHERICVLGIGPEVIDLPGVVVTDQNAASDWVRFVPAPGGLSIVDKDVTFAKYWTHPEDQKAEWRHKSAMCAEVLVPHGIAPSYILGAYVSGDVARDRIEALHLGIEVHTNAWMFFR
jgi:hypothetical protein